MNELRWHVQDTEPTVFVNANDIYQDGTIPLCRDREGRLWGMSGHSHLGHIGMFCGTSLDDLAEVYPIETDFCVGAAGKAFSNVRYPEGVLPRGSIWPFGLYICPNTNRFFCFFHNETGWNAGGTGYIISGPGDGEPDFRHIGLMYSDDCGRTWRFLRWVIASEGVCYCETYRPDGLRIGGQPAGKITLGAGDFSLFTTDDEDFLYIFYNQVIMDTVTGNALSCHVYCARSRKRTDGVMGDFVKYYGGAFCEAGNLGQETAIVPNTWHPRVLYSRELQKYLMTGTCFTAGQDLWSCFGDEHLQLRLSDDLLHWGPPLDLGGLHPNFRTHYFTAASEGAAGSPFVIDRAFSILSCHNGTDVRRNRICWE